ncbi:hypothetical protein E8E14_005820 [Neopestalotiopsis sp. 37M]|nr:hypothetical protein E8E14_005820 [Neopestalotiopsis sp. 37M]
MAGYDLGSHHKVAEEKQDDYKPSTLRMPFLGALLASLLVMVGLLAYSLNTLPRTDIDGSLLDLGDEAVERRGQDFTNRRMIARIPLTIPVTDINSHWATSTANNDSSAPAPRASNVTEPSITKASTSMTSSATTTEAQTVASSEFGAIDASLYKSLTSDASLVNTEVFGDINKSVTSTKSVPTTVNNQPSTSFGNINTGVTRSESFLVIPTSTGEQSRNSGGNESTQRLITETVGTTSSSARRKAGQEVTVSVVTYVTEKVTILTNSEGLPAYTSTILPPAVLTPTSTTLTNSAGEPITTITTDVLATPSFSTLTDSIGVATTTVVFYPTLTASTENVQVFYIGPAEYFVGFCLPTVMSIIIAIPIRVLSMNARLFQPWHALTQPSGAMGSESLTLPTCDFKSYANGLRCLLDGQFLTFLTTILMVCSVLLVPLSAESIVLELRGNCAPGTAKGCTFQLCVSEVAAKAAVTLLAFMCFLTVMIAVSLWRWKTGVYTNPWNICGVAGLTQNKEIRALLAKNVKRRYRLEDSIEDSLSAAVATRRFQLGWFRDDDDKMQYGVMLGGYHSNTTYLDHSAVEAQEEISVESRKGMNSLPFMLGYTGRLLFLALLVGLLALIVYYNNTGDDTAFERFMDSQSFGTKFLFTSVGTLLTLFWSSFVSSVAIISPYQLLAQRPQKAKHSILLSPTTNAFSSILSGMRRRHVLLAAVGVTALLSEFLTIFLSNVPYRATQTFLAARVCAYGSIGIISTMALVVVGSLFIKWPYMPVDPSTIAGAMYYVCDSWMLRHLQHLGEMGRDDCNARINAMDQSYTFGEIVGQSGTLRIGVDTVDDEPQV